MNIGSFDRNSLSGMLPLYQLAEEQGIHIHYIDKLSYLIGDDNGFNLDVLLVNPTLNRKQWEDLLECVQQCPKVKFIFFLTDESAEYFDKNDFARFTNVESCQWSDGNFQRFIQLLEEAKSSPS